MRKTILLVFIHGFKGGDDTFGSFPEHVRALLSHALPKVDVLALTYPRFETRGDLKDCVARFREWLQNKVIDIEVAQSTPSPTVDPSVHTILVGHSMGGIIAAETLLLIASEQPVPAAASKSNLEAPNFPSNTTLGSTTSSSRPNPPKDDKTNPGPNTFMFPHIQGILAFDTPFLGINPNMLAHNLETGGKMASSAYKAYNEISSAFGGWGSKSESDLSSAGASKKPAGALPAPGGSINSMKDAAAAPKWQSWGKYAMFAGAAGAVAAGGAAALYSQREKISAGWGWASGHLLFVGCLARPPELTQRIVSVNKICEERGLGSANFYTNLGKGAREGFGVSDELVGKERTFCNLPVDVKAGKEQQDKKGLKWYKAVNEKATDETAAHTSIFLPRDNPGFYRLGQKAREVMKEWVDEGWYDGSEGRPTESGGATLGEVGDEWVKADGDEREKEKEKDKSVGGDWEGLDDAKDLDGDDDVKMTDEVLEGNEDEENMEGSVIVDKAAKAKEETPHQLGDKAPKRKWEKETPSPRPQTPTSRPRGKSINTERAAKRESIKLDSVKPDAPMPDAPKVDTSASRPQTPQPQTTTSRPRRKSILTEKAAKRESIKLDSAKPNTAKPDAMMPDAPKVNTTASRPQTPQPQTTTPRPRGISINTERAAKRESMKLDSAKADRPKLDAPKADENVSRPQAPHPQMATTRSQKAGGIEKTAGTEKLTKRESLKLDPVKGEEEETSSSRRPQTPRPQTPRSQQPRPLSMGKAVASPFKSGGSV